MVADSAVLEILLIDAIISKTKNGTFPRRVRETLSKKTENKENMRVIFIIHSQACAYFFHFPPTS